MLIETIKQIGVSNYSLLARMTGLNPETVRYKVNTQLGNMGLSVQLNVNYPELGMVVGVLRAKASPSARQAWLDEMTYLSFVGKSVGSDDYFCVYTVPFRFKKKYSDILNYMKQEKKLVEFEALDAKWVRYPSFRAEFYDFEQGRWNVDWKRVDMTLGEVGATCQEVNRDADIDYFDLRILRSMQSNPTVSLTRIAGEMKANPRTVRYHHAEHVTKKKLVLSSNVRWTKPFTDGRPEELMQAAVSFRGLGQEEVAKVRKLVNRIPFTWFEVGAEQGGYFALLDIPMDRFYDTVRYIEANTEEVRDRFSITMLDSSKSRVLMVPDEMFDPRRGWMLPNYRQEMAEQREGEGV
jgi:hypothetical protein